MATLEYRIVEEIARMNPAATAEFQRTNGQMVPRALIVAVWNKASTLHPETLSLLIWKASDTELEQISLFMVEGHRKDGRYMMRAMAASRLLFLLHCYLLAMQATASDH